MKSSTINNNENWVDCFFRARQLLEEKQILDKISNVSFDSKASSEPSSPPPISRKERPLSIGNNVTTLSYTAKNGSQNNAPQNDNVGEENLFAYLVVPRIGPVQIPLLLQDILGFCQAITLVKLRKK